ncbi:MAG: hypothetical protein QE285_14815 [Aquabacterium sp.]|nr:hypothetical protein [Aquabacterium sp.]
MQVTACGWRRSDLHVAGGELMHPQVPVAPICPQPARAGPPGVYFHPAQPATQNFAHSLGATWAAGSGEMPPQLPNAIIIVATFGTLVSTPPKAVRLGGRLVAIGIPMGDVPGFPCGLLWKEHQLLPVGNRRRRGRRDFLRQVPQTGRLACAGTDRRTLATAAQSTRCGRNPVVALHAAMDGLTPRRRDAETPPAVASFVTNQAHMTGTEMNCKHAIGFVLALVLSSTMGAAQAQSADAASTSSPSRAQVRMETKEFLRTHRWDEASELWLLKSGVEPPTGVLSRAEVRARRDEFLRLNRWDEAAETWILRKPAPPTISGLTREEVRAETIAFTRTHHWDEGAEGWVANRPLKPR